ncbi:ATP-binding protein [Heyndrickxia ginsengihumi]|uniref:ATP-binding protein n=1 Tax=Heyndrickxia ginsengihumi TaxID=363870 RepID=UPI000A6B336A|nr:ATP-binding protein [Heyndrickxia ginsengihumi]
MTKEQLQKLGKPYYTTKSEGTGLGLMVTFRLIEAIGGTLTFDSKLNQGTKATICIKGYKKEATDIHYLDNDSIA